MQVLKNADFEKCKLGKMQIWKMQMGKFKFGNVQRGLIGCGSGPGTNS